jgi:hypothetical protein
LSTGIFGIEHSARDISINPIGGNPFLYSSTLVPTGTKLYQPEGASIRGAVVPGEAGTKRIGRSPPTGTSSRDT